MGKYESQATTQPLGKTPTATPSSNPKGGQYQEVGDQVKLNRTPVQSPSSNPKGGHYQEVGDQVKLNRMPIKGWGNAEKLPMSARAIEQSNIGRGSKGRK